MPAERLSRFTLLIHGLLLVVEVGVIHAGRAGHEHVAVPGDVHEGAVRRRGLILVELTDVSEENRRREVALDVRLLEGLNLAGEDVVDPELGSVHRLCGGGDLVEREQGRLRAGAHRRHTERAPERLDEVLELGKLPHHVRGMPCTSRMAGRFSASWHLDCVSWVSTSAVLPELAFLLKVEVKGVGMVSGDGSGSRERANARSRSVGRGAGGKFLRQISREGSSRSRVRSERSRPRSPPAA